MLQFSRKTNTLGTVPNVKFLDVFGVILQFLGMGLGELGEGVITLR